MKKIAIFDAGEVYPPEYYDKSFERAIPCVWISQGEIYCGENHSEAIVVGEMQSLRHSDGFLINGKIYNRDETEREFGFSDSSLYLVRAILSVDTQIELALNLNEHQKRHLAANENLAPETQRILAEGSEEIKRVLSENRNLIDELSFLKKGERMLRRKTSGSGPTRHEQELAAQVWCRPNVSDRGMDVEFAYAVAETLRDYREELLNVAEIFDYYEVTVKEAEDIFDRVIDWADGDNSIDGSDVDNIKDEIIELFKGREIPVEEALDILGGLSELISLKGMEGYQAAGATSAPTYPESFEAVRGLGGGLDSGAVAPTSGGAMEAGMIPTSGLSGEAPGMGPGGLPAGTTMPVPSWQGEAGVEVQRGLDSIYGPGSFDPGKTLVMQHMMDMEGTGMGIEIP